MTASQCPTAPTGIGLLLMLMAVFLVVRSSLTVYLDPDDVMLALNVNFADDLTYSEVASAVERLQDAIRAEYPEMTRIFIEAKNLANHPEVYSK